MIDAQVQKVVTMLPPQLKDDGDFANNTYVDTSGFAHLRVLFIVGTTDAAIGSTAEGTAPKLEECDTTNGTYSAITGAALAAAIADDQSDTRRAIDLDLNRTHKRYVQVTTPHAGNGTTGANLCILGMLSDGQSAPENAADMGLAELVTLAD